jgi:FMN reductase
VATSSERVSKPLRIVGLGGSLAAVSKSRGALVTALEGAAAAGADTALLDLRELDLPMFSLEAGPSAAVLRMVETLVSADGLLWSSPLYQGSISGSFKNALDWLHLPTGNVYLTDKVIGLIAVAGGTHGLQAVNTMEFSVRALRGWAVPLVVSIPSAGRLFDDDGRLQDESVERQLKMLGDEVVRVADHFRVEESPDHAVECQKASERIAAAA